MFSQITDYLISISNYVPLPIFTFIGALVEEVIAPIPSPLVMTLAGSLSFGQNATFLFIVFIALTGSVGKTIGSYFIYYIANKFEHLVVSKFGKYIGVTEKEIELISKQLNKGSKDFFIIAILRAIPIIPTAPVSAVSGLIKLNLKTYLGGTFVGTLIRNVFYIYLGYTSLNALDSLNEGIGSFEKIGYIIVLVLVAGIFLFILKHKKKDSFLSFLDKKSKDNPEKSSE